MALSFTENVTVLGISTDRVFSHRRFSREQDLSFALLSDSDGSVSEAYGLLYDEFQNHRRVSKRAIVVVDPDGVVRHRWVTDDPQAIPDLDDVRRAVETVPASNVESTNAESTR
mgnify:CR=1 FL=1